MTVMVTLTNIIGQEYIEAAGPVTVEHHSRYWSAKEMANLAFDAGFNTYEAGIIVSIAFAESGGYDGAYNWNPPSIPCPNGSADRGILQINDCHHWEVSDACAYDARCSFKEAYRISMNGTKYHEWYAFVRGTFLIFYDDVVKLIKEKIDGEWEVDP